jgi:hypothetical protein
MITLLKKTVVFPLAQAAGTPMMQGIMDLHHDTFFFLILILVFVLWILVRALWHFHYQKNPIPQRIVSHEMTTVLFFFFIWVLCSHFTVAACDGDVRSLSPPTLLPHAAEQIPPEPGMPQRAPGHETLAPAPLPEIPRLEPPLISDRERFMELCQRFHLYYIGRNEIGDLAAFAGRLERAVPIERSVEAALVGDGYTPDRIRLQISQIR